jgi:hypothetical protein
MTDIATPPQKSANPKILTFHETNYWLHGTSPTQDEVCRIFDLSDKQYWEEVALIIEPLKGRGVPTSDLERKPQPPVKSKVAENVLDEFFVLAVNFICDTVDKRSTAAKLKSAGIDSRRWQGYLKNQKNREYLEKRMKDSFENVELSAKTSLARNVEAGDLQSIRYYHEYTGKYRPNSEMTMNLGIIIGRIMEILSSKLEPIVLAEIADEIELVLQPQRELGTGT